jgi:hypothetical protein
MYQPGQPMPQAGQPYGQPGQPVYQPNVPVSGQTGQPYMQPGLSSGRATVTPGTGQNQATQLIQQLLTTPRPGGMPSAGVTTGPNIQGGIAGVASTLERTGIKLYNERDLYNEWEFLYDLTKDASRGGQMGGMMGQGMQGQSGGGMTGQQSTFGQQQTGFGSGQGQQPQNPVFGQQPGFGQPIAPPQSQPVRGR